MKERIHRAITLHIWRVIDSLLIMAAVFVWFDHPDMKWTVLLIIGVERLVLVQFKGFICNVIEDLLHWKHDFDSWF